MKTLSKEDAIEKESLKGISFTLMSLIFAGTTFPGNLISRMGKHTLQGLNFVDSALCTQFFFVFGMKFEQIRNYSIKNFADDQNSSFR